MRRIFLDIETLPPDEEARERAAIEVRRELAEADERVGETVLDEIIERRFRGLALKAEHGRLLAIGIIVEENDHIIHHGVMGRDRATRRFHLDEARTLNAFWRLIADFNIRHDLLIGHNILDFDLPFLCKRSVIHFVRPSVKLCFRRFQQQPVYDTMWEWMNWRDKIKLHELAEALRLTNPKISGLDGCRIYDYFIAGRHEEIADYCLRDTECVREIYLRMNFLESTSQPNRQGVVSADLSNLGLISASAIQANVI